jgi:hypothetical protein
LAVLTVPEEQEDATIPKMSKLELEMADEKWREHR